MDGRTPDTEIWDGEEVSIGGKTYILPPLNLAGMKRFKKALKKWSELDEDKQMDLSIEVLLSCFQRNYPRMTLEELEELVDLKNVKMLFNIAMNRSGFTGGSGASGKADAESPPT